MVDRQLLRRPAYRMTPQRRAVLHAVINFPGHPTAADVYARVRADRPGIAQATVYNALHALAEHGDVVELTISGTAKRYDSRSDQHDHAVCQGCGKVIDVEPTLPSAEALRAAAASGFQLYSQHTQFFGFCAYCRRQHHGAR